LPEQALYLKWRPMLFDEMVGQEHITRTLRNSLKTGRIRHAYLFSGPRGTGKTTTARLLAKAINCQDPDPDKRPCNVCPSCIAVNEGRYLDLIEIDAATHTSVEDVRDLRDKIAFSPGEGHFKVYIIDEVHRFSGSAFDALLKTLEEPPDHAVFVLATTEIDKVPATIKSRCLQFEFRRLSVREMTDRLQMIAESEGLDIERAALELIARQGTGSARDSISLLDQIVADPGETITLELARRILGTASLGAVKELAQAIVEQDAGHGLQIINEAVDNGADPRQFGQQVVEHLRSIMLAQTAGADLLEVSQDERALYDAQAGQISRGALLKAVRLFNEAVNNYRGGWQPQLVLELAMIESTRTIGDEPVERSSAPRPAASAKSEPPPEFEPPPEASAPGTPPVVPLTAVRDQWTEILNALYRYSKTGPDVLKQFFHPHRVDGNIVFLATANQMQFRKLQESERIGAVQRAFGDVFRVKLVVRVLLVNENEPEAGDAPPPENPDVDPNDPLLSTGRELGAKIRRRKGSK